MTRQTKTPKQRAEEALGIATRKVQKLRATERELRDHLDRVGADLREAVALQAHAKTHPALQNPTSTTKEEGNV